VELRSRTVGTEGPLLVMLHPGGTDSRALEGLMAQFGSYRVVTPDQRGHGRTPDTPEPFHFDDMASDTVALIETFGEPVHLFGYSDGAIVALHVALKRPDLVRTLVFVSGVIRHDAWLPGVLDGDPPDFMAEAYGEVSPDGREHWDIVVAKAKRLHQVEPDVALADLAALTMPVLVVAGDDDEMPLEHLLELYRALPDGELAVVPRATHALGVEKPELLALLVKDLHRPERGNGFAPIRRAADV
jgi:pimeloyl-ACP methyl ester carboxylesterase